MRRQNDSARETEFFTNTPQNGSDALRLLFAGGCHVGGFPAGEEFGFVRRAVARLDRQWPQRRFRAETLLHVSLASAQRIAAACRACRPQVLVLQLGHYESSLPLAKRLARLLRGRAAQRNRPPRDVSSWKANYEPNPTLRFHESWRHRLKSAVKLALDGLLRLAGHPAFDSARLERQLAEMLELLRAQGVPQIVVLSPFPVCDRTIARYRRQLHRMMAQQAARQGCHFVDLAGVAAGQAPDEFFADDRHLGRAGHRAVGRLVADAIGELWATAAPAVSAAVPAALAVPRLERASSRVPALQV
jgi:hypothetical protein